MVELFWWFWGFGYVCNLVIGDKCWLLDSEGYKLILRFVLIIIESKYIRVVFIGMLMFFLFVNKGLCWLNWIIISIVYDYEVSVICWIGYIGYKIFISIYCCLWVIVMKIILKVFLMFLFLLDIGKEIYEIILIFFCVERWLEDRKILFFGILFDLIVNFLSYYCRIDV